MGKYHCDDDDNNIFPSKYAWSICVYTLLKSPSI
jgi:hypothetical protein